MSEPSNSPLPTLQRGEGRRPGRPGIGSIDVHRAADALLREGQRPTVERIRARVGSGSPNTIQPLLDGWWRTLAARLDAGPAALHRIPEPVLHIVEALWLQVLEEARRRAGAEVARDTTVITQGRQELEVRSYVLSLREGELTERLRLRDQEVAQLRDELAAVMTLLRKTQAERAPRNRPRAPRKPFPAHAARAPKEAPRKARSATSVSARRAQTGATNARPRPGAARAAKQSAPVRRARRGGSRA